MGKMGKRGGRGGEEWEGGRHVVCHSSVYKLYNLIVIKAVCLAF